jgi:Uma2 family endonuclease
MPAPSEVVFSALREARAQRRYLRPPRPLFFPTSEEVPETRWHFELRTALFQILQAAFGENAVIGSDQFLYWEPANPRACVAPDVMVRLGEPDAQFDSWKVWERGAPQLAVELISKADASPWSWAEKIERYRHVGLAELVRFEADDPQAPLRLWDNVDGDLVERDPAAPDFNRCDVLQAFWNVRKDEKRGLWLRLTRDAAGSEPFLTPAEHADAERQRADAERQRADAERQHAELRLAEVEAELARLKSRA